MSLDVYLKIENTQKQNTGSGIFIREEGQVKEIGYEEWAKRFPAKEPIVLQSQEITDTMYKANITHNLAKMAEEAGIYYYLWRPEEIGISVASQLIEPLESGLNLLRDNPERFKVFNPANGWGTYDGLVGFVTEYLDACKKYPDAVVSTWR